MMTNLTNDQYASGLTCPYCNKKHLFICAIADIDESSCCLMLKCYACGKRSSAMYSFLYYEDEDGKEIGCGH